MSLYSAVCSQVMKNDLLSGKQAVAASVGISIPSWQHGECLHFISIQTKER